MRQVIRRQILLLIDLALIAIATVAALWLRDNFEPSWDRLRDLEPYLLMTLLSAILVLPASGANRTIWRFSAMTDYLRVIGAVAAIVLAAVAIGFLSNRLDGIARSLPVIQGLLMAFLLIGARVAMRLRHVRRRHISASLDATARETIVVVGINTVTELFLRSVAELAPDRLKIGGIIGRTERHSGRLLQQYEILGVPEDIKDILKTLEVHGVFVSRIVITMPFSELSAAAAQALLDIEKESEVELDFFAERLGLDRQGRTATPKSSPSTDEALTFSVAELESLAQRPYRHAKRLADVVVATILIASFAPLILILWLLVLADVGFPAVFWQQRPGLRGKPFKLYKFRTMRNAHDERGNRIPDEQRTSAFGSGLRRTRLDELPQIFNILIGEMSFVGPRPLLPVDQSPSFAARLLVRPGLTGWAQVTGGREVSARDKAALDVWYVRNASLALDIKILILTLPMLVLGERLNRAMVHKAWDELSSSRVLGAAGIEGDTSSPPRVRATHGRHAA